MSNKKRIGIFGGSFDPPHKGHRKFIEVCCEHISLDQIYVIPSYQTPNKLPFQVASKDRLQLVKKTFEGLKKTSVLDIEIKRKTVSYTVDTLDELYNSKKINPQNEVFLLLGDDLLSDFGKWKGFEEIIKKVNLIIGVYSTEKQYLKKSEWPLFFRKYIQKGFLLTNIDGVQWKLKTNRDVYVFPINEFKNLSSKNIRKKVKSGQTFDQDVEKKICPIIIEKYGYLKSLSKKDLAEDAISFLKEKGALHPQLFQFEKTVYEYIIIASGLNTRHVRFLFQSLKEHIKTKHGFSPQYVEGEGLFFWAVSDYGFLIIHILYDYLREYYQLEDLWTKSSLSPREK